MSEPSQGRVLLLVDEPDQAAAGGPTRTLAAGLEAAGLDVHVAAPGEVDADAIHSAAMVILTGGVRFDTPAIQDARRAGIPVLEVLSADHDAMPPSAVRLAELQGRLMAARRLEVLGRLVGGVAHDFNNVLSVVSTLSELLLRFGPADDPDREDLEEILAAARRGSELTRQLQAFSRADVGDAVPVHLGERLLGAEKLIRKLLPEDVAVVVQAGEGVPRAWLDPVEVDQILFNLAAHGRWVLRGGGSLRLATETGPDGQPCIVLDLAPRFAPPADADSPLALGEGMAVPGLASVEEIVGHRDGRFLISQPGAAAERLEVHLPVAPEADAAPPSGAPAGPVGGGRRVLVVDDEDAVREAVVRLLRSLGFQASGVAAAGEALAELRQRPAEAVVCDAVVRDAWGTELRARAAEAGLEVPFVFFSGHEDHAAVRAIRDEGHSLLRKPLTAESLAESLAAVLGR